MKTITPCAIDDCVRPARSFTGRCYCQQYTHDSRIRNASRDAEIVACVKAGSSLRRVAQGFGISPERVRQILQEQRRAG